MIRIFTLIIALLWGLTGHAATKKKYPGGKQYMYRLTLTDKHSGRDWLSTLPTCPSRRAT